MVGINIRMPETCGECFARQLDSLEEARCGVTGLPVGYGDKSGSCPLVWLEGELVIKHIRRTRTAACTYQKENGKPPCCTHDCEGCVWYEVYEDEEEV